MVTMAQGTANWCNTTWIAHIHLHTLHQHSVHVWKNQNIDKCYYKSREHTKQENNIYLSGGGGGWTLEQYHGRITKCHSQRESRV